MATQTSGVLDRRARSGARYRLVFSVAVCGLCVAGLLIAEAVVRLSGAVDFPIYSRTSTALGYLPLPNQAGAFLNKNAWCFNDQSMGVCEPFRPSGARDILLVGDSVVLGGNPLNQPDKIGPQLATATGAKVWPIAAGGWGLANELAYLRSHPAVVAGADEAVFLLDAGDLDGPAVWGHQGAHPTRRPVSALVYLARKYALGYPRGPEATAADVVRNRATTLAELRDFVRRFRKPVYIVLYADRPQAADPTRKSRLLEDGLAPALIPGVTRLYVQGPEWSAAHFRDGIHPSAAGSRVVAQEIARQIGR